MASAIKVNNSYKIRVAAGKDATGKRITITETYHPSSNGEVSRRKEAEAYATMLEKRVKEGEYPLTATITKHGNSYTVSVPDPVDNENFYTEEFSPISTSELDIKNEVLDFARQLERDIASGKYNSFKKMTFKQFVAEWDKQYASNTDNLTLGVKEGYIKIFETRVYSYIGNMKIIDIETMHLNKIYADMAAQGRALKTIKRTHTALRSVFTRAKKWKVIPYNPCDDCDIPKVKKTDASVKFFTPEEARKFLDFIPEEKVITTKGHKRTIGTGNTFDISGYSETFKENTQWSVYFTLSVYGGFRRGELIALTWNDIDFAKHTITINKAAAKTETKGVIVKEPKNARSFRTVSISKSCFKIIEQWYKEQKELSLLLGSAWLGKRGKDFNDNNVFIQMDSGIMMHVDSPTAKFKKLIVQYNEIHSDAQIPEIHLHGLRHTNVSILISANMDITTISERLGHSPEEALKTYSHMFPSKNNEAADILELALAK